MMVERLFLAVPWGCLRFVIEVFTDHTHLLSLILEVNYSKRQRLKFKVSDSRTYHCGIHE